MVSSDAHSRSQGLLDLFTEEEIERQRGEMAFPKVTSITLKNKKPNLSPIPCSLPRCDAFKIFHPSIYPSIHLLIYSIGVYECIRHQTLCMVGKSFQD